jgi:hypothetical protein
MKQSLKWLTRSLCKEKIERDRGWAKKRDMYSESRALKSSRRNSHRGCLFGSSHRIILTKQLVRPLTTSTKIFPHHHNDQIQQMAAQGIPQTSRFLLLPPEIRNQIYDHVFSSSTFTISEPEFGPTKGKDSRQHKLAPTTTSLFYSSVTKPTTKQLCCPSSSVHSRSIPRIHYASCTTTTYQPTTRQLTSGRTTRSAHVTKSPKSHVCTGKYPSPKYSMSYFSSVSSERNLPMTRGKICYYSSPV